MKKLQTTARSTLCFCLFLALFFSVFCGIPFLNIPAASNTNAMNLSSELAASFEMKLFPTGDSARAFETLRTRLSSLPYDDVERSREDERTVVLPIPSRMGGATDTLAQNLCGIGKITYTDVNGNEIIPSNAIEKAQVGYGVLDPNSANAVYYLEFFLKDEFRSAFREETKKLSEAEIGNNILTVNLDGSAVLQATVGEEMTESTFIMGGYFTDATLPNLYAAYVNADELDSAISYTFATETPPTLGTNTLPLMLSLPFVCSFLLAVIGFFFHGTFAIPVCLCTLLYSLCALLFFQISRERLSVASFIGILVFVLVSAVLYFVIGVQMKKESAFGRDSETAFKTMLRKSALPIYFTFGIFSLICGILLAFTDGGTLFAQDLSLSLFVCALLCLSLGYPSLRLFSAFLNDFH